MRFIVDPKLPANIDRADAVVYLLHERRADRAARRARPIVAALDVTVTARRSSNAWLTAHRHRPAHAASDKYYVPHGSPWPIVGSIALFTTVGGAAMWLNHVDAGPWVMTVGPRCC